MGRGVLALLVTVAADERDRPHEGRHDGRTSLRQDVGRPSPLAPEKLDLAVCLSSGVLVAQRQHA